MFLIEARQLIWDDIISEIKKIWEHLKLFAEQKAVVKTTEFFILSSKEEDVRMPTLLRNL